MRHAVAILATVWVGSPLSVAAVADAAASQAYPVMAEYSEPYASGASLGMFAVATGFVLAGAWLLYLSARYRG